MQIVDNQLEEGEPEATVVAYRTFQKMGYTDYDAKQMIGAAIATQIYDMMVNDKEFDENSYVDTLTDMLSGNWDYEDEEEPEIPEHLTLKDALLINNDEDLLDMMADDYDIEPSDDEEETAEDIATYLLNPKKMEQMILAAREGTVNAVEKVMKNPDAKLNDKERDLLTDCGDLEDCLFIVGDGRILVPDDVAEVWKQVYTKDFEKKRKKVVWLRACLETAAYYYGVFDINVFMRLVKQKPYLKLEKEEVLDLLEEMPEEKNLFVKNGERFIEKDIADDEKWKALETAQGDYPFMVPSAKEINDIGFYHYPYHEKGWIELRQFIEETEFDFIADDILPVLFHRMTMEDSEEDIEGIMEEENVMPDDEEFSTIWTLLYGNTRLLALRGGKRSEGKQPAPISNILFDQMLNLEDRMDGEETDEEEDFPHLFS